MKNLLSSLTGRLLPNMVALSLLLTVPLFIIIATVWIAYSTAETLARESANRSVERAQFETVNSVKELIDPIKSIVRMAANLGSMEPEYFRDQKASGYLDAMLAHSLDIDSVYVGFADGTFKMSVRARPGARINGIEPPLGATTAHRWIDRSGKDLPQDQFTFLDPQFRPLGVSAAPAAYDPRLRPWFKDSIAAGDKLNISEPYIYASTGRVGITISMPFYDKGSIVGIVAADVTLDSLSKFLASRPVSKSSLTLIMDKDQRIVAYPDSMQQVWKQDNRELIRSNLRQLTSVLPALAASARPRSSVERYTFEHEGSHQTYLAMVSPLPASLGKPWDVLIVAPLSDFTTEWDTRNRQLLLYGVLFLVLELLLLVPVAHRLNRIRREKADAQVATMAAQREIEIHKSVELTLSNAATKLRESENLYRLLTEDAVDVIWKLNSDFRVTYISPADERLRGYRADEVIGHYIFEMFTDEGVAAVTAIMKASEVAERNGTRKSAVTFEVQHRCKDGSLLWGEVFSKLDRDSFGSITGYHGITREITGRKQMEEQVRQLAFQDPLTNLPNRRLLNDRTSQTMATSQRSGRYGALMFLDLDNFKPLNDRHGHEVGDLLLMEVADRLRKCVRATDTVARIGGDEFVVILSELNADWAESRNQAQKGADKIRLALSEPYSLTKKHHGQSDIVVQHHCTVSIGVALFLGHESSQENVLKWADAAMYEAKDAGRNLIRFYDSNA